MSPRVLPFPRPLDSASACEEPQRWRRDLEAFDGAVQDARDAIAQLRDEGMGLDLVLLGFTTVMEEASRAEWGVSLKDSMGGARLEALLDELWNPKTTTPTSEEP